ncbi:unnamed protein product [Paramecium sonneborni]|uniref:PX domain-containing protein n=1 Tax=Paramecium sonneborni TaxID=65129 RepID=A0A8S1P781_9CILI|nr:unnamed protein product [Paramecium sonneborni]
MSQENQTEKQEIPQQGLDEQMKMLQIDTQNQQEQQVTENIQEKVENKEKQEIEEKQGKQDKQDIEEKDDKQEKQQASQIPQNIIQTEPEQESLQNDKENEENQVKDQEQRQQLNDKAPETNSQNMENLFLKPDYSFPIEIKVCDPVQKGGSLSNYIVYTIKGKDCFGQFETQRRFNEFFTIRELLLAKWPGQYVPPIPEKSVNAGSEIIVERIRLLNIFCMKIMQIKHLYYSEEFYEIFLRSTNPDINKQIAQIPKQNVFAYTERYKQAFQINEIKEISPEMIKKMSGVQSFLKLSQNSLTKLLDQAKSLSSSRKQLKETFFTIFGLNIAEYEKQVLQECVPQNKLIFTNTVNAEILELAKKIREPNSNSLDKIQDLISTEQRDIEAFLQAFQTRDSLMQSKQKAEQKLNEEQSDLYKIMKGNSTMKGSFSKLSLDEQKQKLELQLNETQKEVDQYKLLFQLVTDVLTSYSIDKFKKDKHQTYKTILADLAQCEQQYLEIQQQFWSKVEEAIKQNIEP